eukprot:scaffold1806_cov240-Pinguiococcus_pyrenoidosus.AAC.8
MILRKAKLQKHRFQFKSSGAEGARRAQLRPQFCSRCGMDFPSGFGSLPKQPWHGEIVYCTCSGPDEKVPGINSRPMEHGVHVACGLESRVLSGVYPINQVRVLVGADRSVHWWTPVGHEMLYRIVYAYGTSSARSRDTSEPVAPIISATCSARMPRISGLTSCSPTIQPALGLAVVQPRRIHFEITRGRTSRFQHPHPGRERLGASPCPESARPVKSRLSRLWVSRRRSDLRGAATSRRRARWRSARSSRICRIIARACGSTASALRRASAA